MYKAGDFVPVDGLYKCTCDNEKNYKKGEVFKTCLFDKHLISGTVTQWELVDN